MALLRNIKIDKINKNSYPFSLKIFQDLALNLDKPVTILVGENGSGKSTLLELIATKLNLNRISEDINYRDQEFNDIKTASKDIKLDYLIKPQGFFFRSEDFISYLRYLEKAEREAKDALQEIETNYVNKSSYSKALASMPHNRTLSDLKGMYQNTLTSVSHGEAYLDFFQSRLRPGALYLLDEAEVPLSVQNQLALMLLIKEAIEKGSQFIIATHSPILMSYPGAVIYELTDGVKEVKFEDIRSVQLLKDFLNNNARYLHHLFK